MMNLNCEYVRDVYPDVLNGVADPAVAEAVRSHISSCAECREEAALVASLQRAPLHVPAGLHERIVQSAAQPRPRWHFRRSDVAMAAVLAAALLGGGIYLQQQPADSPVKPAPASAVRPATHGVGAVGVEDALMTGKSSLDDLSVEQLEKLLGEVQS